MRAYNMGTLNNVFNIRQRYFVKLYYPERNHKKKKKYSLIIYKKKKFAFKN